LGDGGAHEKLKNLNSKFRGKAQAARRKKDDVGKKKGGERGVKNLKKLRAKLGTRQRLSRMRSATDGLFVRLNLYSRSDMGKSLGEEKRDHHVRTDQTVFFWEFSDRKESRVEVRKGGKKKSAKK